MCNIQWSSKVYTISHVLVRYLSCSNKLIFVDFFGYLYFAIAQFMERLRFKILVLKVSNGCKNDKIF